VTVASGLVNHGLLIADCQARQAIAVSDAATSAQSHTLIRRNQGWRCTTNMDFEFNQSSTTSGNGVTPGFPPDACLSFGAAYLKSRSSDSFTAALKDFVPPAPVNVSNCGKVRIIKTDDAGTPLDGAEFTLFKYNPPIGRRTPTPA